MISTNIWCPRYSRGLPDFNRDEKVPEQGEQNRNPSYRNCRGEQVFKGVVQQTSGSRNLHVRISRERLQTRGKKDLQLTESTGGPQDVHRKTPVHFPLSEKIQLNPKNVSHFSTSRFLDSFCSPIF